MSAAKRPRTRFSVLSVPSYRRVWLAQIVSQLGDSFTEIALIYYVGVQAGSPLATGLILFAMLLPGVVVGPFAGVLADRMSQKRLMIAADIWRFLVVGGMIPAVLTGNLAVLFLLVALEGAGSSLFTPARTSLVPQLVGVEHVPAAISLSQATTSALSIAGPSLGGLIVAFGAPADALAADALSFLVSALLLTGIRGGSAPDVEKQRGSYLASLAEGARTVGEVRGLGVLLRVVVAFSLVFGVINTVFNTVLLQSFHLAAGGFGVAQTAYGVGAMAGSLLVPMALRALGGTVAFLLNAGLVGAVMASVLLVAANVALPFHWPVFAWAVLLGSIAAGLNVTVQTLLVLLTPGHVLGRVASLAQAGTNLATVVGILAGGLLAGAWTPTDVIAGAGAATVTLALVTGLTPGFRALRAHEARERREAAPQAGASPSPAATLAEGRVNVLPLRETFLLRGGEDVSLVMRATVVRVLSLLETAPMSLTELVAATGIHSGTLEEELGSLVRAGLVLAEDPHPSRDHGEPTYRLAKGDITLSLSPPAHSEDVERVIGLTVSPGLDRLRLLTQSSAGPDGVAFSSQILHLSPNAWRKLSSRLQSALQELREQAPGAEAEAGAEDAGDASPASRARPYVFTILSFPLEESSGQHASDEG